MSKNLISIVMPTYNRDFIIELAILSIIHQKEHTWNIELLVGDDGNDNTEEIINSISNINPKLEIRYFRMDRISISDKVNYLIRKSKGEYYGLIGSDDIQSPYKISSFEKALSENPTAQVFGQRAFVYHDIIFGNANLWTQNKKMTFFKAGSFVIISRKLFEKVGGYPKGLWKRVDGSFYKKIAPLKPEICDVSKIDERVIKTSIALQHFDNIWDRKAKGLHKNKPKQLANFYAEPIELNLGNIIIEYYTDYLKIKDSIKFIYNNSSKNNLPSEKKWWSFLTQRSGK